MRSHRPRLPHREPRHQPYRPKVRAPSKPRSSLMPSGRAQGSRQTLTWPLIIVASIFALFFGVVIALYFAPHPELLFSDGSKAQPDFARTRGLTVGDVTMEVPRPYLAEVEGGMFGPVRRFSLRLPWPYKPQRPVTDDMAGDLTRILAIDVTPGIPSAPARERLSRIYPVYFDGEGEDVGDGLTRYGFRSGTPYQDTVLYVAEPEGSAEPVLISCTVQGESDVPPLCERRIDLSDRTVVTYRFHEDHVGDWREIEATVRELLREYRAAAGSLR